MNSKFLKAQLILSVLFCIHLNGYSQDFKSAITVRSKDLTSRLIKGVGVQRADHLMIDALMDDDWEPQFVSMSNGDGLKRQAVKWTSCGYYYDMVWLTYTLEIAGSNVIVDVEVKNSSCVDQRTNPLNETFYKNFWNSLGRVRFFDELEINPSGLK